MGGMDYQMGIIDEVTYGTALTVTRFYEYEGDAMPIKVIAGRTEGNPMRVGSRARRQSRVVPYLDHAEGHVDLDVMNKGFGVLLKHLMPSVASSGVGPFVYTATEGSSSLSVGKSFTAQFNAPFHPTGTNQAFTFSGGKIPTWSLTNDVDGLLVLGLDLWFNTVATGVALATASYPSSMTNFSWAGGVVTVGGSAFDVTNFSLNVDQGMKLDRAQIRGNTAKKEPTPGVLGVTFSLEADFSDLTSGYNRVQSATVAGLSASIVGTWTNGTDIIAATIPGARFDDMDWAGDPGALGQTLTGVGEYDGTNSPLTLAYTTSDSTP